MAVEPISGAWLTAPEGETGRGRRRARRVSDLLLTTAIVVGENGFNNTSLEDIAERLDLSKASIYHYFDSKESLVLAMLSSCHEFVIGRLNAIARGDGSPEQRLREMISAQISLTTTEIPEFATLFLHPYSWPDPLDRAVRNFREKHDDVFRKVIDEGVKSGDFNLPKPSVNRLCMQGALTFIPDWFKPSTARDIDFVVDTLMSMFLNQSA